MVIPEFECKCTGLMFGGACTGCKANEAIRKVLVAERKRCEGIAVREGDRHAEKARAAGADEKTWAFYCHLASVAFEVARKIMEASPDAVAG